MLRGVITPPVQHVAVFVEIATYEEKQKDSIRIDLKKRKRNNYALVTLTSQNIFSKSFTVVIKAMCDLMSDNHSYPAKVKSLVLLFAEEGGLQDSCWKH